MRNVSHERIGEYLKISLNILKENNNSYPSRLLIKEMEKRLVLDEYEKSLTKTGGIRWIVKFRFFTVGLVKGGYIKKEKKQWFLTKKGEDIVDKEPLELIAITDEAYEQWEKEKGDEIDNETELTIEEILGNINPVDIIPASMRINPSSICFSDLIKGVDKSTIQIPPFQRDFVWSAKEITFLLDSIYNGYPIGSFIFWKSNKQLPHHREIGGIKLNEIPRGFLIDYIIDGQQRITSLYAAVKGADIEGNKYRFYFDLTTGKFDYERLKENGGNKVESDYTLIPLEKLFVDANEYFGYVKKFPDKIGLVLNNLYEKFKNYSFSVIYVQNEEEDLGENNKKDIEKIIKIFSRINDTGKKLTVVAKMIAKCWEKDFDLRKKLSDLIPNEGPLSMIREETILQIASVILNDKKCKSRNIIDDTNIEELEIRWEEIEKSFLMALTFIKDKIRIKNYKFLPFDSVLVPLAYFYNKVKNPSNKQIEQLFHWFWLACLSNRYGATVEGKIEEDCKLFDEMVNGNEIEVDYLVDWQGLVKKLKNQKYNLRNAFCKTVLSLYSYQAPKNLKDNSDVELLESLTSYSRSNFHHVFPRNFLKKIKYPNLDFENSVVNIIFAPAILNIEISDRAPSDYIEDFRDNNNELENTLKSHLITDIKECGLEDDNFDIFIEKRADIIAGKFREVAGLKTKIEVSLEEEPNAPIDMIELNLRLIINQRLEKEYGENYWNQNVVPSDIKQSVSQKIIYEINKYPFKKKELEKSENKLLFLEIMDYNKIILSNWSLFDDLFNSKTELERYFVDLKNYRNPVKHGRKIDIVVQKNGEASVLWFKRMLIDYDN